MTPTRPISRHAFTLIEVIVVIVMLAILAGIVVPRMAGGDRRLTDAQADRVASVLSIIGWRAAVAPESMELEFDPVSDSLRLLVNRAAGGAGADAPGVKGWRPDPLVAPIVLDRLAVREVWWGSQRADRPGTSGSGRIAFRGGSGAASGGSGGAWRIAIPVDRPREPIVLVLADKDGVKEPATYRIELAAGRTSARVTTGAGAPAPTEPDLAGSELDLDALGLGEQPW